MIDLGTDNLNHSRPVGRLCNDIYFKEAVMNIRNGCLLCFVILTVFSFAEQVPDQLLQGLSSDEFKLREASQVELDKWVNEKGSFGIQAIFKVQQESDDPEVRFRCLKLLRSQSDKDYLNGGKGYLGVKWNGEFGDLAGEDKPRMFVRVTSVVAGSPAELSGIQVGDLIGSCDGKIWRQNSSRNEFSETISSYKSLEKIELEIKRAGKDEWINVPVILGRRPADDLKSLTPMDIEKIDREVRDRHFKEWIDKQMIAE